MGTVRVFVKWRILGLSYDVLVASIFLVGLLNNVSAFASDNTLDPAVAAFARMDYVVAREIWQQRANDGDATAQTALGGLYAHGRGVPRDYVIAESWFRKAATQEFAPAQYALGMLFLAGQGVAKDDVKAAFWMRKASDQGFSMAQFILGEMYKSGQGVRKDDTIGQKLTSDAEKSLENESVTKLIRQQATK